MRFPSLVLPMALALLAAAPAAGQTPSQPEDPMQNVPVRLGPVGLAPAIAIHDVGRDNNVFNEPTDPKSDFIATISPKLDVFFRPGPLRLTYTTSTDYVYYQTYTSERGVNVATSGRAELQLGPFRPFVSAGRGSSRERFNREIDVRARHHDTSYAGGVDVQLFGGVSASVGAKHSQLVFDPGAEFRGQNLDTAMNSTTDAIDLGGGVAVTPLTTVRVTYTRERSRFEFTPDRNSESYRIVPSVSFSPLAFLNGNVAFGYRHFTAHSPDVPDYAGFVSTVTLGATFFSRYRIEGTISRDLSYSYDEATPEYLETALSAALAWQIAGPVDLRLTGGRSRLHYRSPRVTASTDDDTAATYGFSLGYRLRERLRAGLNGDWRGRESERSADRTYDNRRLYANLSWGI
jgi:hypothetical protein